MYYNFIIIIYTEFMYLSWCESLWHTIHFSFRSWKKGFFLQQERPFSLWQEWRGGCVWQWRPCQAEMLLASVYHLYPSPSCPCHLNYFLWQKCTELLPNGACSWKPPISQTFKAAAGPRVTNAPTLVVFFYGEESTLGVLFSFLCFQIALRAFFQLFSEILQGGLC